MTLIDEELARASGKTPWYLRRAEVLAAIGEAEAASLAREGALMEATRLLGKRPTAVHRFSRAKVYIAMGRLEEAERELRLVVQRAPRFAEATRLLRKLEGR